MRCYLACFDIADNKIRNKVGKLLLTYGDRVQYSVFEVAFNRPADLENLKNEARELMEAGDDLRFYYLNEASRQHSCDLNGKKLAYFPASVVV